MNELFDNAIDSIEFGVRIFLHGTFDTAHKHALLAVFHGVELLLKARLYEEHPLLIYKKPESRLSPDAYTVSLADTLARFANCGIDIPEADADLLDDLRQRRNRIAHHRYEKNDQDYGVLGKALRFVYYFLPTHLETTLEEHLDEDVFDDARKAILSYEERLEEALAEVEQRTTPTTKEDLAEPTHTADCPECGNHTVVIGADRGDFCFFCRIDLTLEPCPHCGEFLDPELLGPLNICERCFAALMDER